MTLSQWQGMGYDTHSMLADPENQIFIDYPNNDFHLLQNAQAVNAGTNLVLPTAFEDLDNISRPQGSGFDIGCYEYNSVTNVEEEIIANDFILYQNYPNPFNPSTRIRFVIPNGVRNLKDFSSKAPRNDNSLVTLKVYDVLGNEIAILVDELKAAGNYEIDFNARNLPSGVYLYRIQAGDMVQTKSMILIK
jgi:hypothetical protein